jgi:HlyD family secretion protein
VSPVLLRLASRRWRRRLGLGLAAAVVAGLLVWGFRPTPALVDVEPVTRGALAVTVEDEGRTRVIDRYEISAPIASQTRRITLDVGDPVREGDVLVTLDAVAAPALDVRAVALARARVGAAEAALATAREDRRAAEATARFARAEAQRVRELGAQELVARSAVEQAEAEARRAEALERSATFRMRTAASELEATRTALAHGGGRDPAATGVFQLRAPVSGRVLRRHFESSRVVQPGEPILVIGDPASLQVEVDVLSSDAVRISAGQRVELERWGGSEPLGGRVRRVEPVGFTKISALGVEEQRVWVIVELTDPPERWARLGDGYRVNARFVLWEAVEVLRVPTSSLFRHGEVWAVFVAHRGRARLRPVEIAERGSRHTRIISGVVEGERVIVHPGRDLADGARIRVR